MCLVCVRTLWLPSASGASEYETSIPHDLPPSRTCSSSRRTSACAMIVARSTLPSASSLKTCQISGTLAIDARYREDGSRPGLPTGSATASTIARLMFSPTSG